MRTELLEPLFVLVIMLNFAVVGGSRLRPTVMFIAFQGALLGAMSLIAHHELSWRIAVLALATVAMKGLVIPRVIFYAVRQVGIPRQINPRFGLVGCLMLEALVTGLAVEFGARLPLAEDHAHNLLVPTSLSTLFTGFLVLISRRDAITQVLGYLVLENGIFVFGLLLLEAMPMLVEVGVLLDLFVGVFVMGIIINHIHRAVSDEYPLLDENSTVELP